MRRLRCDVLVASDWHLGSFSTPQESRLALAFLERAGASETDIILNGDIFEGLFESRATAESAHPAVVEAIQRLGAAGRLRRTEGNHDPGAGEAHLVVEHSVLGRVLVAHGHTADPSYGSWPMRLATTSPADSDDTRWSEVGRVSRSHSSPSHQTVWTPFSAPAVSL